MTYWVDQSCTDRAEWDARIVTDAIRLVTSTYSRNERDNGDSAFQSSFKDAFNAHQDDSDDYRLSGGFWGTPSEIVEYTSGSIASLTETSNQVTSNIRIYCEYDPMVSASDPNARWKLVPDRAGDPKGPNSQRTLGVNQEWFDQINYVRRSLISLGCQTVRPGRYNLMETFGNPIKNLDGYNAPAGVPYYRSVISVSLFPDSDFFIRLLSTPRFRDLVMHHNTDEHRLPLRA